MVERAAIGVVLCLIGLLMGIWPAQAETPPAQWGRETLEAIQAAFWLPERHLYANEAALGQPIPDRPAFMWGCGVQLSALAAAARMDRPAFAPQLRRYADALNAYWTTHNGIGGYDVLPGPKPSDRYYDDNAWIVLALVETYEVTQEPHYRQRAEETFRFVLSGEDETLGGGIYWHENERNSKNTCSNAPSAAAALRLYQVTSKPEYLQAARRLYAWTNAHLQDKDGLFFDHIRLDGSVEPTKWSYNSALMIRTNGLFYTITHEKKYLEEAQRIARAAEARWVHPDTGALSDEAAFAHLLAEAFLAVYDLDRDTRWLHIVQRALMFLHDKGCDPNGHYGPRWDTPQPTPLTTFRQIDQASAARAYWVAARYPWSANQSAATPR